MFDIFMDTYIYKAGQLTVSDRKKEFNELIHRMNVSGGGYILITRTSGHDSDVSGWVGRTNSVICVQFLSTTEYKDKFWTGHTGGNITAKLEDGRIIELYDPRRLDEDCLAAPSDELREELDKYDYQGADDVIHHSAVFYVKNDYRDMAALDKALKEEDQRRAQNEQWRKEREAQKAQYEAQARERDAQQRASADEVRSRLDSMFGGQNSGADNRGCDQNTHNIIICECGQYIRYPLHKGTVVFTCPRCSRKYKLFTGEKL